jgi:phosphatidylglycerol:prolipoprotein diacylglycerol transferase
MNWQYIYTDFNPIAFNIGSISVHWYGIMYATALILAVAVTKYLIKIDKIKISQELFDSYIWWAEIGVILGARLGYILFYDSNTMYYITHPWQIFNPFINGMYAGISGMSYHGALLGFIIATFLFARKHKISMLFLADLSVIGISAGYIFGRIGNFLNQELVGRATDVPWGIYVGNTLRHPSALYESFLEGFVIFIILFLYRKRTTFTGQLALLYIILYSIARIVAENFRQPDIQLGFLYSNWLTMGILQSSIFAAIGIVVYYIQLKKAKS